MKFHTVNRRKIPITAIRCTSVNCKRLSSHSASRSISVRVRRNDLCAVLGRNGCGKTTLLRMLLGDFNATSSTGRIEIAEGLCIGACPQESALFEHLTVGEHLLMHATLKSVGAYDVQASVDQALCDFQLEPLARVQARMLSGGWRQRLQVANAFCGGSDLVLLDEPTRYYIGCSNSKKSI